MENIQEYIQMARLLARHLSGQLNEDEEKELKEWCGRKQENTKVCEKLQQQKASLWIRHYEKAKPEEQWAHFQQHTRSRKQKIQIRSMGIAAGLCLIASVSLFLHNGSELPTKNPETVSATGIQLVLSNGDVCNLSKLSAALPLEGNATVAKNQLAYQTDTTIGQSENIQHTVIVPKGESYHIILPDSTQVWLNSDSRLTYPVQFAQTRKVQLTGEAFFQVTRYTGRSFLVETGSMQVKVLGTTFNVNAYPDNEMAYTALEKGKVEVYQTEGGKSLILQPGEVAEVNKSVDKSGVRLSSMSLQEQTAWRNDMFCFRQTALSDILKEVGRYYNVRFIGAEETSEVFSGDISRSVSLQELLDAIRAQTTNLTFQVVDRVVYVKKK